MLGGAHGFDGQDDVDSSHEDALLQRFIAKLGDENVVSVRLGSSTGAVSKFSLANVVSWLRVEDVQGNLQTLARRVGPPPQECGGNNGKKGHELDVFETKLI